MGSLVLETYLYSPWSSEPTFAAVVLYGVFPALGLSGVVLWQQGRLTRLFRGRGGSGF